MMTLFTQLRLPYMLGALLIWNLILGAGLFFFEGRYFGLALSAALITFGCAAVLLSYKENHALLKIYRLADSRNNDPLYQIRLNLRLYGFAFLIAGCFGLIFSLIRS